MACINLKCKDPCPGTCATNADCKVISHTPNCVCSIGFVGDPFVYCQEEIKQPVLVEKPTPCIPSPCGINAECREKNGAGSCICLPDYIGNPYEVCRPECTLNSDCPSNKACTRNKCQDPCPGVCGQNAECQVINHLPSCNCIIGYSGDPFTFCSFTIDKSKFIMNTIIKTSKIEFRYFSSSKRHIKSMPTKSLRRKQSVSRTKRSSCLFLLTKLYRKFSEL